MKKVLITGATGGLAQSLAENLTKNNWQLVLVSRNSKKLQEIYGDKHTQIIADC